MLSLVLIKNYYLYVCLILILSNKLDLNQETCFTIIMRKSHLNDEFLVLLGQLFTCSNEEKNKQKQQRVLALILSLCYLHVRFQSTILQ